MQYQDPRKGFSHFTDSAWTDFKATSPMQELYSNSIGSWFKNQVQGIKKDVQKVETKIKNRPHRLKKFF